MAKENRQRGGYNGIHAGHDINIQREPRGPMAGRFYIIVTDERGCYAYDGWAPEDVRTLAQAKQEALYGACLEKRP